MAEILTEFTQRDMTHGVLFTIPGDGGTQYETHLDEVKNVWIYRAKTNELTAKVAKVTKNGFHWSKWYFGKLITGFLPWTVLRKVVNEPIDIQPKSSLHLIIGHAGSGMSILAETLSAGKKSLRVPIVMFSGAYVHELKDLDVLILDECCTSRHIAAIAQYFRSQKMKFTRRGERIEIKTPDLIAIFQRDNISSEAIQQFEKMGAVIHMDFSEEVSNG